MNFRTKGLGFLAFIIPPFVTIPVRMIIEAMGSGPTHGVGILSIVLSISGVILFGISLIQDQKVGIDLRTRDAWTRNLMESPHTFFNIPIRLIALGYISTSLILKFL